MVVILSHFDSRIGPRILITYPEIEITADLEKIKIALDYKDVEGFVSLRDTITTLSYFLPIYSPVARGRQEITLISYIITETEPNEEFYKDHIKVAAERLKNEKDIWKAFEDGYDRQEYLEKVRDIIRDLDIALRMRDITTVGYCIDEDAFDEGYIPIPRESGGNIQYYLMVYKKERDGSFGIKGYPLTTNKVYKMEIFTDQINIGMVRKITTAFQEILDGTIVYTSGICQATAVCSFELYFEYEGEKEDVARFRERLLGEIDSHTDIYPMIIYSPVHIEKARLQ